MPFGFTHRLAQFRTVKAQPLPCLSKPRTRRRHQPPVRRGVIEPLEVHELMNHHVVAHPVGHGDEPPVQADMPVPAARTPARALIANTDLRHAQAVCRGELVQANGQLRSRPGSQPAAIVGGKAAPRQRRALPDDPLDVAPREGVGFPARAAARNRHAHAPVEFDAKQVAAGAAMAHEVDGCNRVIAGRCEGAVERRCGREDGGRCGGIPGVGVRGDALPNGSPSCTGTGYPIGAGA